MNQSTPTAQPRIPRPMGLTLAIRKTSHLPPQQRKKASKEIYKTIIRNYIQEGLSINGQVLPIQELGIYLNLTYKQVMVYVGLVTNDLAGLLNPKQLQASHRALLYQAINNSLADRGRAQNQYEVFARAQCDDEGVMVYRPFISGQANQAVDMLIKANKGMLEVVGRLVPSPTTAIQHNHFGTDGPDDPQAQYIGIDEAMKLINAGQKEGTVHMTEEEIFQANNIDETPEVRAKLGDEDGVSPLQLTGPTPHEAHRELEEGITDTEEMG